MRPPQCDLCGASPAADHDGLGGFAALDFADHQPLPPGMVGHPTGTHWLCGPHACEARPLRHLTWPDARGRLVASQPPAGATPARTTPRWDESSMPDGLRQAHQLAPEVWGRLEVQSGALTFTFDDDAGHPLHLEAGHAVTIPPRRPHHVTPDGAVEFQITFLTA